ncbi:MAG: hypothetical protein ACFUZC_21260 [Chthoniobacteraceae bacterium]
MLSRRAILAIVLLLPLAAQAESATSGSKKRHHRSSSSVSASAESGTRHKKSSASRASKAASAKTVTVEASALKTEEPAKIHRTARTKTAEKLLENAEPTVITSSRTVASSRLSTKAIDAIPASESSLYDRRTAQESPSVFSKWFGPKADGVRYDSRMIQAAQIAETRARAHSVRACWRYVKEALLAANVVDTYPQTALAKQAGDELINRHGFRRLAIRDPFKAPVGSVIVYGGPGAGHVEIRTAEGFVSDFESPTPSRRPLLGVFVKPT